MLPEDCLTIVKGLLHDVAPNGGYAALLLRHPVIGVYFPCAIVAGAGAGKVPATFEQHYYLYSAELESSGESRVVLSDNDSVENLVRRGKLALALCERGPVVIRTFPCHPDQSSLLCLIARKFSDAAKTSLTITGQISTDSGKHGLAEVVPSNAMLGRLAAATRVWHFVAPQVAPPRHGSMSERATNTARLLADVSPTPPWVPVLYAAVTHAEKHSAKRVQGGWHANALSYNCLLLKERRALAKSFIRAMFDRFSLAESTYQELAGLIDEKDVLLRAIVGTCRDLVQPIGSCPATGARAFGRRNIPRNIATDELLAESRYQTPAHPFTSNWMLIRGALEYLKEPKDECALVTAWVGGQQEDPLPVGLVPGEKSEALAAIAGHVAMSEVRVNSRRSSGGLLAASIVPLEYVLGDKQAGGSWAAEPILSAILDAVDPARAVFPGPYTLDFRHGNDLHITSDVSGYDGKRVVLRNRDPDLIDFLFMLHSIHSRPQLAVVAGKDVSLVGHAMIKAKWLAKKDETGKPKYQSVQRFIDTMKDKLRDGTPPVQWNDIFAVKRSSRRQGASDADERDGGCYWLGISSATGLTTEASRRNWPLGAADVGLSGETGRK